ncbi:methylmalonyl-CoA mutase small subunit [Marinilabilia rubra]|uniref:Methylmalonyl-CoA mutase small subunit n=1 Tax=Marinilabilia rubra TaxID=2162893 RepID=A0A2U2B8H6_9BACT|nr:methylmalonyl-CoA mutase small subunit [Marinilabilia rubra]PWD99368.1 methylmalonyl-CoA mutase small subunit [Marinilabilia rubra]
MADKSNQPLFSEFAPVSTQEWMDKITADLKGADFDKKLVWKTNEGFNVRPFYREEDLKNLEYLDTLPGEFPFVRGTKAHNKWLVRQDIVVKDAKEANEKALDILNKGVDSLGFFIENEELITKENVSALLKNIVPEAVELNFSTAHGNQKLYQLVVEEFAARNCKLEEIKGSLNFDPLGSLTVSGKSCVPVEELLDNAAVLAGEGKAMPQFQTISVNAKHFNNAGASIVQELAFGLAIGNEYLAQITERNQDINTAAKNIRFNFAVGGNYFMEIAKLRAGRMLWAKIVDAYKPVGLEVKKMHTHCETSEWNKTIYDPYVNMLRTQTEAMSATIGGTDSLTVAPFDQVFRQPNVFSERIARNQQLLLKEESYFSMIVDPSAGSYYIENLTDSIASEAWKLFVEVEEKGGYTAALKAGFIQAKVNETSDKRKKELARRKDTLLGTNQYPNNLEAVSKEISEDKAFTDSEEGNTVEPIQLYRGAEEFEALRLATERATKRPKVFMLTYGNLAMRLARSQFSGNFFGCAGYEIIDNLGFETVEEGVDAAKKAGADVVVLCSSDEEYTDAAPAAFKALNGDAIFVVAGAPACADDLKAQGIEHFINVRTNLLETLQGFNKMLNIQ